MASTKGENANSLRVLSISGGQQATIEAVKPHLSNGIKAIKKEDDGSVILEFSSSHDYLKTFLALQENSDLDVKDNSHPKLSEDARASATGAKHRIVKHVSNQIVPTVKTEFPLVRSLKPPFTWDANALKEAVKNGRSSEVLVQITHFEPDFSRLYVVHKNALNGRLILMEILNDLDRQELSPVQSLDDKALYLLNKDEIIHRCQLHKTLKTCWLFKLVDTGEIERVENLSNLYQMPHVLQGIPPTIIEVVLDEECTSEDGRQKLTEVLNDHVRNKTKVKMSSISLLNNKMLSVKLLSKNNENLVQDLCLPNEENVIIEALIAQKKLLPATPLSLKNPNNIVLDIEVPDRLILKDKLCMLYNVDVSLDDWGEVEEETFEGLLKELTLKVRILSQCEGKLKVQLVGEDVGDIGTFWNEFTQLESQPESVEPKKVQDLKFSHIGEGAVLIVTNLTDRMNEVFVRNKSQNGSFMKMQETIKVLNLDPYPRQSFPPKVQELVVVKWKHELYRAEVTKASSDTECVEVLLFDVGLENRKITSEDVFLFHHSLLEFPIFAFKVKLCGVPDEDFQRHSFFKNSETFLKDQEVKYSITDGQNSSVPTISIRTKSDRYPLSTFKLKCMGYKPVQIRYKDICQQEPMVQGEKYVGKPVCSNDFYIFFVLKNNQSILKSLEDTVRLIPDHCSPLTDSDPLKGQVVIVKGEDGVLKRCVVTNHEQSCGNAKRKYLCHALDYGQMEFCSLENMYPMVSGLEDIPPLAHVCVIDTEDDDEDLRMAFNKVLVKEKETEFVIRGSDQSNVNELRMEHSVIELLPLYA